MVYQNVFYYCYEAKETYKDTDKGDFNLGFIKSCHIWGRGITCILSINSKVNRVINIPNIKFKYFRYFHKETFAMQISNYTIKNILFILLTQVWWCIFLIINLASIKFYNCTHHADGQFRHRMCSVNKDEMHNQTSDPKTEAMHKLQKDSQNLFIQARMTHSQFEYVNCHISSHVKAMLRNMVILVY